MSKNHFFGLSLNERLARANLSSAFSGAVKSGNAPNMSQILGQVQYSKDSAKATIDTFLQNPNAFKK